MEMRKNMQKVKEINIADYRIRRRDSGDLRKWLDNIDSVLTPISIEAAVERNNNWEDCIVSGKVAIDNLDQLNLCIYFSDGTSLAESASKQMLLK